MDASKSFLESFESLSGDEQTISIVSERQFEFDDVVTNSQAYRRVLVAATHTLRNRHSENISVREDSHNLSLHERTLGKEANTLGTQGADQARKINAVAPPKTTIAPAPDKASQNDNNRRMTVSDPNSFV